MPLPTLTRPLLILATLLVVAGLAAGVSAFIAATVSGQTTGYGVLPLRYRAAHQGAGIETSSLIGERCKTVDRQYTPDDPPNPGAGAWATSNSTSSDPLSPGLPADQGDSDPNAVLERWVDLGAGNQRLVIECSYPDPFNPPNDRRIRHYIYATTQTSAAAAPTAAEIKAALTGNNGIESANVVNNTLTGDDVHNQTLTADDFADESVDGRVVKHRSLPATVLVEDSITGNEIGPGAVGTGELEDGVVTLAKLSESAKTPEKVNLIGVPRVVVRAGTVESDLVVGTPVELNWDPRSSQYKFNLANTSAKQYLGGPELGIDGIVVGFYNNGSTIDVLRWGGFTTAIAGSASQDNDRAVGALVCWTETKVRAGVSGDVLGNTGGNRPLTHWIPSNVTGIKENGEILDPIDCSDSYYGIMLSNGSGNTAPIKWYFHH